MVYQKTILLLVWDIFVKTINYIEKNKKSSGY